MKLVIVESPTKAKTLSRFLGKEFQIEASMGHIIDLPKSKLGVNVEDNFEPEYELVAGKSKIVRLLKTAAKNKKEIILATDPDREGEAIAYHVREVLGKDFHFSRIVFHEITKEAIETALKKPGQVDIKLFEAQQARRVLDRLVGYKLSPVLWRKVRRGLSAGRVQSVAVKLIVEREKEIKAFKPQEYWEIKVELTKGKEKMTVALVKVDGKKASIVNKEQAEKIVGDLEKAGYKVSEVLIKEVKKHPLPPFITSTLQRSAGSRLGWSAKKTMREAQQLYEKGLITYHRTDSFNLAKEAITKAREYIVKHYSDKHLPATANYYKYRSKSAQGAHEAIRPTKVGTVEAGLSQAADRLYRMIWERFVACQMKPALIERTVVKVKTVNAESDYDLQTTGERLSFDGWLAVNKAFKAVNENLPKVSKNDELNKGKVLSEQKFTQPPGRYSEAGLIKVLEQKGIGRPSTYAPIISTIQTRNYVEKKDKQLWPTAIGVTVTEFLDKYFDKVMDYEFTALMENNLDEIATGEKDWHKVIGTFYLPFEKKLDKVIKTAERMKIAVETIGKKCPECKQGEVVIRTGRFGKFLSCERFPDCKYTAAYKQVVEGVKCAECGGEVVLKKSRRGKSFFGCANYPKCKWASWNKPKPAKE